MEVVVVAAGNAGISDLRTACPQKFLGLDGLGPAVGNRREKASFPASARAAGRVRAVHRFGMTADARVGPSPLSIIARDWARWVGIAIRCGA